jgi:hypothetical protein
MSFQDICMHPAICLVTGELNLSDSIACSGQLMAMTCYVGYRIDGKRGMCVAYCEGSLLQRSHTSSGFPVEIIYLQ